MNQIKLFFNLCTIAVMLMVPPLFAQNIFDQVCVPPEETNGGLATTINYPYYPPNGTLKALVIFVKFTDDNFDLPPHTDLWPHDVAGLPSWAPNIISPTVQPNYSNPSISGYFDECR